MIHALRHYSPINQEILKQAASNILLHMHTVIGQALFHFLLQKVKTGVEVKILCHENVWHQVGLTSLYMKNFRQNGGEILWLKPDQSIPSLNFLIIDQQYLLRSTLNSKRKDSQFEVSSDKGSITTFLQFFQQVNKEASLPILPSATTEIQQIKADENHPIDQRLQIEFKLLPEEVKVNQLFELHWKVIGAQSVTISHSIGNVALKGSRLLKAVNSTNFQLEAISEWGRQIARCHLEVDPAPVIEYHLSTPDWPNEVELPLREKTDLPHQYGIIKGQMIRLRWTVYQAETVTLNSVGQIPASGYRDLVPQDLSSYIIIAKNKHSIAKQNIIVHVFDTPALKLNPPKIIDLGAAKVVLPTPPVPKFNPEILDQAPNLWKAFKNLFNSKKIGDE